MKILIECNGVEKAVNIEINFKGNKCVNLRILDELDDEEICCVIETLGLNIDDVMLIGVKI